MAGRCPLDLPPGLPVATLSAFKINLVDVGPLRRLARLEGYRLFTGLKGALTENSAAVPVPAV